MSPGTLRRISVRTRRPRTIHSMYIRVQVETTSLFRDTVRQIGREVFIVSIKPEEAERQNKRVVDLIAKHFEVPARFVKVWSGKNTPRKMVVISDEALATVQKTNNDATKHQGDKSRVGLGAHLLP